MSLKNSNLAHLLDCWYVNLSGEIYALQVLISDGPVSQLVEPLASGKAVFAMYKLG